jgi:hypothetical protein
VLFIAQLHWYADEISLVAQDDNDLCCLVWPSVALRNLNLLLCSPTYEAEQAHNNHLLTICDTEKSLVYVQLFDPGLLLYQAAPHN